MLQSIQNKTTNPWNGTSIIHTLEQISLTVNQKKKKKNWKKRERKTRQAISCLTMEKYVFYLTIQFCNEITHPLFKMPYIFHVWVFIAFFPVNCHFKCVSLFQFRFLWNVKTVRIKFWNEWQNVFIKFEGRKKNIERITVWRRQRGTW